MLGVLWLGWSAWSVYRDLSAARMAASDLETALRDQDGQGAQQALTSLQDAATAAADRSGGPTWDVLGLLPVVGGDVDAVSVMSETLREVSGDGLTPLVRALRDLERGTFDPQGGRLPLAEIAELAPRLERSQSSFDRAATLLAEIDDDLLLGRVAEARDQLDEAVAEGLDRLGPARRATRLLPPMLGADGPRRYLLVLQNNAEVRSTGGFAGSTFLLETDDGEIDLVEPVAGNTFEFLEPPGLPLTDAERALFTDRAATRFVDANFIPDFPRAAELWRTRYEQRFDTNVDGVISTDPVTLSYLLAGEEPITVQGVSLTAGNVVQELLSTTYARLVDPAAQDEFFKQAGAAIFDTLLDDPDPQTLINGLRRSVEEGRTAVVSMDDREQDLLADGGLTGALPATDGVLEVGVYVNDTTATTGSKLSYYLEHTATVETTGCAEGVTVRAGLDLRSTVPGDPAGLPEYVRAGSDPVGTQDLMLFLLGPPGGRLGDVRLDGAPVEVAATEYAGRPAVRVELSLAAGQARRLTWAMQAPAAGAEEVHLEVTPGVQPRQASVTVPTGCA